MKRIQNRSAAALLLAAVVFALLCFFVVRLAVRGGDWAAYSANKHIYENGVLRGGTITDRNGVPLVTVKDGKYTYAEDSAVRCASLHALGDHRGYIGSGALSLFAKNVGGYSFVNGTPGGETVTALTLDAELQAAAWKTLGWRTGSIVVLNYETGEVLCMASSPSYDPAWGPEGSGIDGLYINRSIGAAFTPGSVFKLVTLTAASETIPDLTERRFTCEHEAKIGGGTVHCTGWHGEQTIEQALANSCNCAFAALANEIGGETLALYAEKLGVSGALTLDGTETASGRFDIAAPGSLDEAWSGVGQYNDLVTPYAMARLSAAIANGGEVKEPTLLKGKENGTTRLMDAATAEFVGDCMNYTVVWSYGKGTFPGLDLCAKTGTAELDDGTTHAWFTGYLRSGAPLAFAVCLERGGGGLAQAGSAANYVLQKAMEIYTP